MADIAAADVVVTVEKPCIEGYKRRNRVKIEFGDGALTYPAEGVPLPGFASFGLVRNLDYLILTDANDGSGITWKYDQENKKLRGWQAPAQTHAHDLLVKGGQAAATTNVIAHYATDILGKEAATDATIAGDDSATKGGVLSATLAAADGAEITGAVAAQVLYAEAVGW